MDEVGAGASSSPVERGQVLGWTGLGSRVGVGFRGLKAAGLLVDGAVSLSGLLLGLRCHSTGADRLLVRAGFQH